jgi:polyhydroxybutyrate depolymerase
MKKLISLFCFLSVGCLETALPPEPNPVDPTDPCAPGAVLPNGGAESVVVGGLTRTFNVHVPASYDGSPIPVVLNFHGLGSNGFEQEILSEMTPLSDAENFIVVYPDGTGESWNAGECCAPASSNDVDDVAFVNAILDGLSADFCVDQKRVYATGMSNGGFFSHRLGCELAERIAAIAPVAGGVVLLACNPTRPVPVMHFHGTADTIVPFSGLAAFGLPPIPDMIAEWAARDNCQGAAVQTFLNGDSHCETFENCDAGAEVTLCTVEGGGHNWPGGFPVPQLGFTTQDLDASAAMWDFFLAHPLP